MKTAIAAKFIRHILTAAGGAGFATDDNIGQLSAALSFIVGLLWSLWEIKSSEPKTPGPSIKVSIALMLAVLVLPGCAKFSGYTEKDFPDGTKEHVHFRGFTLMDGKAKLAQGRSFLGKTASVGVIDSDLESSGESVVKAIEALPAAIKAAIVPTP